MKRIVVLGAGFGGLTIASELGGKAELTLIDRNSHFSMGFSMQWVLAGRRKPEEGQQPYTSLKTNGTKFVQDSIIAIDTANKKVKTKKHTFDYDYLVVALGAELVPELVSGQSEGAHNLCDLQSFMALKKKVEMIKEGTIVIAVSSTPFKCPPMPYEYCFLLDDILRKRGTRDKVRIIMTTPEPQPMPVAGKIVGDQVRAILAEKGIEYLPQHKPKLIDPKKHKIVYENGFELSYDI